MMDSLRRKNGIGFDSPMAFAIKLPNKGDRFTLVNDTILPERRWQGVDLELVTYIINDFHL